jgi:hypothetical protein
MKVLWNYCSMWVVPKLRYAYVPIARQKKYLVSKKGEELGRLQMTTGC